MTESALVDLLLLAETDMLVPPPSHCVWPASRGSVQRLFMYAIEEAVQVLLGDPCSAARVDH